MVFLGVGKMGGPYFDGPGPWRGSMFCTFPSNASLPQSVNVLETINVYQYRIYKLDVCSNNFHILRSDKGEIDVYRFMSKHHITIACHTSSSMRRHA